jgi:hypothetical protein
MLNIELLMMNVYLSISQPLPSLPDKNIPYASPTTSPCAADANGNRNKLLI